MTDEEMLEALAAPGRFDEDNPVEIKRKAAAAFALTRLVRAFERIADVADSIEMNTRP